MGCSPPGAPTLGGCSELGCGISSARWCPREVLAPQHNPARGPAAGRVPGWFWGAGDAFPSTVHKQEANPLPCQTPPQIPTPLIPKYPPHPQIAAELQLGQSRLPKKTSPPPILA